MTVLLAVVSVAGVGVTVTAGHYRRIIRDLDTRSYQHHWTVDDVEAFKQELAVQTVRAGVEHRGRVAAEHVARQVTGLLVNRRRHPIPLPARHTPIPDYGDRT